MSVGKRIKELRVAKGLTQGELAKMLGKATSMVSYYERDETKIDNEIFTKLGNIFKVSIDYMLGLSEIQDPKERRYWQTKDLGGGLSKRYQEAMELVQLFELKDTLEKYEITPEMLADVLELVKRLKERENET